MDQRLKNIIGLMPAESAPACYVADLAPITTSETGLYITDLPETSLHRFGGRNDCQPGNVIELLEQARTFALKSLQTDLLAALATSSQQRFKAFGGVIGKGGQRGFTFMEETTFNLVLKELRSVNATISSIGVITDTADVADVYLPDGRDPLIGVATGSTPPMHKLDPPLLIPADGSGALFRAVFDGGANVGNNTVSCGCSASDRLLPDYITTSGGSAGGFVMELNINCKGSEIIYLNYQAREIGNEVNAQVLAWAVRYKAAETFLNYILNSSEINRYTLVDREHLYGSRNHCKKEYENRIVWLATAEGLDLSLDSCYTCKHSGGPRKSTIWK